MKTAALYARYSTERQSESSIADQLRVCRDFAHAHGYVIGSEFTDEGISGAAFGNRPGAQALEQFAISGACQIVLAVDLTRLSRSSGELSKFMDRMRFKRVRVLGVQDGYDSESRTARMQAGLSGIMSEEFRVMIADRTRAALSMRAQSGEPTGGRAYGYRDGEAEIVREIFQRFADGDSLKTIASDLNRRDVPSPGATWRREERATHGRWLVSALHSLIKNERYAGRLIWNRSQWVKDPDTGRRRRVERPSHEWTVTAIDPIVPSDLWAEAQLRFSPSQGKPGGVRKYLLSGLLECAVCGSKFIVIGGSQQRYMCGTFHAGGPHACSNRLSTPRKIAEERILKPVMDDLLAPEALEQAMKEMRAAVREMQPAIDPQIEHLQRMVREGLLSPDIAEPAIAEAKRRAVCPAPIPLPSLRLWRDAVGNLREVIMGADVTVAREALRDVLGPIRLSPGDGHLVAEIRKDRVLLATGSGPGIWTGSGGAIFVHLPTSVRDPGIGILPGCA